MIKIISVIIGICLLPSCGNENGVNQQIDFDVWLAQKE